MRAPEFRRRGTLSVMANDDESDHDRGAILARRQRFIAIALTSLAAACANRPTSPQPCLSPPQDSGTHGDPPIEDPPTTDTGDEPPVDEPPVDAPPVDAPPQPCLKVAKPG